MLHLPMHLAMHATLHLAMVAAMHARALLGEGEGRSGHEREGGRSRPDVSLHRYVS
jgi:hypothetical protein